MAKSIKLNNNLFWTGEIYETGDANGGHYIKFANGIMITMKSVYTTAGTSTYQFGNNPGVKVSLGAQPANFTQLWSATGTYNMTGNTRCMNGNCLEGVTTSSMGGMWLDRPGSNNTSAAGYVEIICIGRWK